MIPILVGALCCLSVVLVLAVVALAWWAWRLVRGLRLTDEVVADVMAQTRDLRIRVGKLETAPSAEERLAKAEKRLQALSLERGLEG